MKKRIFVGISLLFFLLFGLSLINYQTVQANGVVSQKEKLQNSLIFALNWPGIVDLNDSYSTIFFLRNKPDFILRGWFFLGAEPVCCDPEEYELIENETDYKRQIESLTDLMHAQGSSFFAMGFMPVCKKGEMKTRPNNNMWPAFPKDALLKMGFSEQQYLDAVARDEEEKIPKWLPFMARPAVLSPVVQNWWLYRLKYAIDRGSDGFHYDTVEDTLWDVTGNYVREYFKEFLRNNFTQDELKEKLAIDDIDNFDYLRHLPYLKENNMQRELNDLNYFYLLARLKGSKEAQQKISDEARQYAKEEYGRDFIITGNQHIVTLDHLAVSDMLMAWEPFSCMPSGSEKLTIGEQIWQFDIRPSQIPIKGSRIAENKWWNNIYPEKRAVIFPDKGSWPAKGTGEEPQWSMEKMTTESKIEFVNWYAAEAYANGNGFVFAPWMDFNGSVDKTVDFLRSHKDLLLGYKPDAQVGLVFSYPSFFYDAGVTEPYQDLEYKKTGHYLATKNIQWEMVPLFDGFVEEDSFSIKDINKYDLLILSSAAVMTQNQRDVIQQFIAEGKQQVIIIGDRPKLDVKLNPLEELKISEANHLSSLEGLTERIDEIISRRNKISLSEENIKVIVNQNSDSKVMHVINYDFDEESLRFNKKKSVRLAFESSENFKPYVKISSLERGDETTILNKTGDLYEMVIPELNIWTIIELERY